MPEAISSSSVKREIDSTPARRFCQNGSTSGGAREAAAHADDGDLGSLPGERAEADFRSQPAGRAHRPRVRLRVEVARQGGDRGVLEQLHHGQAAGEAGRQALPQLVVDLRQQQRVAAEVEEVVVDADPLDAEDRAPGLGDDGFQSAARRGERRGGVRPPGLRRGQGLAVHLAVGRQRQLRRGPRRPRAPCTRGAWPAGGAAARRSSGPSRRRPRRRRSAAGRPARPPAPATTAARTGGCCSRAASISPSSMRKPRTLT